MESSSLEHRLDLLAEKGVELVDRRQIFVDGSVRLDRIYPGSVLFPGTRLIGRNVLVAPAAKIGSEGPATIVDSAIGEGAEIASGYVAGSVLLEKARVGPNGHVRAGTLLEEEASTAHCVGLKQTILMSFVTLGSLINCCDCLISGGRSRSNHTEIGSGFIHFNFTPWGENGDKATPSLIGEVPKGVFLREERIFIGGISGMVGPGRVGFGSFTTAGQVIRSDVPPGRIHADTLRQVDASWDFRSRERSAPRAARNLEYIGHLAALRAWYQAVRRQRIPSGDAPSHRALTVDAAIGVLDECIAERWTRLGQFLGRDLPPVRLPQSRCPLAIEPSSTPHLSWVKSLDGDEMKRGLEWLEGVVRNFVEINEISK